jgi:hypothetical protein
MANLPPEPWRPRRLIDRVAADAAHAVDVLRHRPFIPLQADLRRPDHSIVSILDRDLNILRGQARRAQVD